MHFKNILCSIFILFVAFFILTNFNTVNAGVLTQPTIGTITGINSGTDRIVEMLQKEPKKEEKKPVKNSASVINSDNKETNSSENNHQNIEKGSESEVETFYPPSELKRERNAKNTTEKINALNKNSQYNSKNKQNNENENENNSSNTKISAAVGGGILKVDTGDRGEVKNKIGGADIGFLRELKTSSGILTVGGVIDYSHNNYDTNVKGIEGDGKSEAFSIGIVAKQVREDGFYYEGSARLGRAKTDFHSNSITIDDNIVRFNFEESAPIYAGHAKFGKIIKNNENHYADIYGIYTFAHQDRVNATSSTNGNKIRFGSIDSNNLRAGCRMSAKVKDGKIYYGIAYQYETSAKVKATRNGRVIDVANAKGGSGLLELGYELSTNKDKTLTVDLNATGFAGRQKGFILQAQFRKTI